MGADSRSSERLCRADNFKGVLRTIHLREHIDMITLLQEPSSRSFTREACWRICRVLEGNCWESFARKRNQGTHVKSDQNTQEAIFPRVSYRLPLIWPLSLMTCLSLACMPSSLSAAAIWFCSCNGVLCDGRKAAKHCSRNVSLVTGKQPGYVLETNINPF